MYLYVSEWNSYVHFNSRPSPTFQIYLNPLNCNGFFFNRRSFADRKFRLALVTVRQKVVVYLMMFLGV